jgi:hypothetical protein
LNISHLMLHSLVCLLPTQGRPQLEDSTKSLPTYWSSICCGRPHIIRKWNRSMANHMLTVPKWDKTTKNAAKRTTRIIYYFRPSRSITSSSAKR